MKTAIQAICKNETPYLNEYVNYHLSIGFDHIYIYDNDSTIPVRETIKDILNVSVIDFPGQGRQIESQNHMLKHYGNLYDWVAMIDVDEFIVPKKYTNIKDVLSNYLSFGGLGVNWMMFGTSGLIDRDILIPVTQSFTHCKPNIHIKSIVQPKYTIGSKVNPHAFKYVPGKYCVNENKEIIHTPGSIHSGAFNDPPTLNYIQLNHYYTKSLEEFKIKHKRYQTSSADGSKHTSSLERDSYSVDNNCCMYDYSIQKLIKEINNDFNV